jgi:hypothetical protein
MLSASIKIKAIFCSKEFISATHLDQFCALHASREHEISSKTSSVQDLGPDAMATAAAAVCV